MTMTDDLLNVSKISSGVLDLKPEIFNLNDSILESIATFKAGDDKNIFAVTGNADLIIKGDKFRIEQVLVNLISNASKYSPQGSTITIHVTQDKNLVKIEVIDKGIGIDTEKIPHVFKKFIRLESATHVAGYGLGLYISQQIVRKHGGTMGLESEKGKGSAFWFTIPH
jgi:signal transduction histidine kinase